jgi:hypothetical protein
MIWVPYANIIIILAATIALVGTFALTTLNQFTTPQHASFLSIICGIGFGASQTLAVVFSQSWVPSIHQSFVVSVALTVQIYGGTLGLVIGGLVLNTQITHLVDDLDRALTTEEKLAVSMAISSPDILRQNLPAELVELLLEALAKSVQVVFYTCATAVSIAWVLVIAMRWRKIKLAT